MALPYLEAILSSLGFKKHWISLITTCVNTINYFVLMNGSLGEVFTPSRRLRQGNPLPLYLFLLCVERFSFLMDQAQLKGDLKGSGIIKGYKN